MTFVARSIARNWTEFRSLHVAVTVTPAWIGASALTVFATYLMQIESWRRILRGWHQRLPFAAAARTWSLANLGRYVPGKVWSVAGLVVLAQRAGVQPGPAAASAFAIQAVSLGSGVAVVAAAAPHSAPPLRLAAAGLVAVVTIGALAWRPTAAWLGRLANATPPLEPLALGYVLGLLALFAPGGVGVRELVLIGLLAPFLGSGGAVAVSLASRVLLTVLEGAAALLTFPIRHRPQESVS